MPEPQACEIAAYVSEQIDLKSQTQLPIAYGRALHRAERPQKEQLEILLKEEGSLAGAARRLNMNYGSMMYWAQKFGVHKRKSRRAGRRLIREEYDKERDVRRASVT